MLSRESFLKCTDLAQVEVDVPQLGGKVFVRVMTAGERDRFEQDNAAAKGRDIRARILAATACDEAGQLLFAPADIPALSKLPGLLFDKVCSAANRLNKVGAEDIEQLAGESKASPSGASGSSSPGT